MATQSILIDTSIFIEHLRKKNKKNSQLYKVINNPSLFISSLSVYELFAGAINAQKRDDVSRILTLVKTLPFTKETAELAGMVYLSLRSKNELIDMDDILIGATALTHNLKVMTLNVKHFKRMDNLDILSLDTSP